jgi:hypothetical protein
VNPIYTAEEAKTMSLMTNNSILYQMSGILLFSLVGFIATIIRIRNPKINAEEMALVPAGSSYHRAMRNKNFRSIFSLILFFVIFVVSLISLVYLFTLKSISAQTPQVEVPPTPTITLQPASPVPSAEITTNKFTRLDEIMPIVARDGNFFYNGWRDGTAFKIDGRAYSHGIGILFSGTENETSVKPADSPNNIPRSDCKEVSMEYALRGSYSQLDFSIGVDSGEAASFGDEMTNGKARLIILDKAQKTVLFDTDWVNYSYATYDKSINVTNVDVLQVIYRTCGVSNENKLKYPLRFAIVDPILILKDDAE